MFGMGDDTERGRWRIGLAESLLAANFGVMVAFCLATIPWAMRVEKNLTELNVRDEAYAVLATQVEGIRAEQAKRTSLVYRIEHDERLIDELKKRIERLEHK